MEEARQQYRRLVRRWHPDQFADDAVGLAEATEKMRLLNEAVATIEATLAGTTHDELLRPTSAQDQAQFGRRLTGNEIDEIAEAIGTGSWAGYMGKIIVVVTPFYLGAELMGRRGTFGHLYSLTEYERALGMSLMALGVTLGWFLFRSKSSRGAG